MNEALVVWRRAGGNEAVEVDAVDTLISSCVNCFKTGIIMHTSIEPARRAYNPGAMLCDTMGDVQHDYVVLGSG